MKHKLAEHLLYRPVTYLGGERVHRYLKEYKSRDNLSPAEVQHVQSRYLDRILDYAYQHVPYYRETFQQRTGPSSEYTRLAGIPLLEKADVRDCQDRLIATKSFHFPETKTTSGSTGHPVTVIKNRDALARERAATWRGYSWAGIPLVAPQALVWGIPHGITSRLKTAALDFVSNRRRFSAFGTSEDSLRAYHGELMRFKPYYIYGYVSAVLDLLRVFHEHGLPLPHTLRAVVTTAELLDADSRKQIEEFSGLPVFNEYGCGEVGSIAHECDRGQLHVMSDNVVIECVPKPNLPIGLGELVVTDLHNRAMPLIRYRIGDLGIIAATRCDCGRPYPILERIVGRAYDLIYDSSGRSYHPEAVLYVFEDIRRQGLTLPPYQAVQSENGRLAIVFETQDDISQEFAEVIVTRFQRAFDGELSVSFSSTNRLQREQSGKLRVVKRAVTNPEH